jgi:hypothetical protein
MREELGISSHIHPKPPCPFLAYLQKIHESMILKKKFAFKHVRKHQSNWATKREKFKSPTGPKLLYVPIALPISFTDYK